MEISAVSLVNRCIKPSGIKKANSANTAEIVTL